MNTMTARENGFTILEGLIAVVIFAVGMIALATFQGGVMEESGEVKARNAAVVMAQDKLDELRAMMVRGDFDTAVATGNDTPDLDLDDDGNPDFNTTFTRTWAVSDSTSPEYKLVEVAVAWTDPDDEQQSVNMDTLVAWNDPRAGLTQGLLTTTSRPIPEPSGGERNPGVVYDELPGGAIDAGDGLSIYVRPDGKTHLIRNDRTDTDGDGYIDSDDGYETVLEVYSEGVVMLRGVIDLLPGALTTETELTAEVLALTSDAGFCVYPEPDGFYLLPDSAAANDSTSTNFFHCYVGENWYGNLGITGADKLDSICPLILSYDPVISTSEVSSLVSATSLSGASVGSGIVSVLANQNFVIARLLGADTCDSFATQSPTATITGYLDASDVSSGLGDTRIEATPDLDCPIVAVEGSPGRYSFTCTVDTGSEEEGWDGTVRLIPDATLGVCDINTWSLPEGTTLYAGAAVDSSTTPAGPGFRLASLARDSEHCGEGKYEYTITVQVTQVGAGGGIADEVQLTGSGSSCVLSSLANTKKSAVYRCAVIDDPGDSVRLYASVPGHTVSPSELYIRLPAEPSAGGSWDFEVTAPDVIEID